MIKFAFIEKLPNGQYRVLSRKGKNLGTYPSKEEAEKRLKQVEYFKHMKADNVLYMSEFFLKEASRLTDLQKKHPELSDQIQELSNNDPSGNDKYLDWMVKQLVKGASILDIVKNDAPSVPEGALVKMKSGKLSEEEFIKEWNLLDVDAKINITRNVNEKYLPEMINDDEYRVRVIVKERLDAEKSFNTKASYSKIITKMSEDISYSATMRKLRKNPKQKEIFQKEFKKSFDEAYVEELEDPEKIALIAALKSLDEDKNDSDDIVTVEREVFNHGAVPLAFNPQQSWAIPIVGSEAQGIGSGIVETGGGVSDSLIQVAPSNKLV